MISVLTGMMGNKEHRAKTPYLIITKNNPSMGCPFSLRTALPFCMKYPRFYSLHHTVPIEVFCKIKSGRKILSLTTNCFIRLLRNEQYFDFVFF